ncbi:MAG: DUF5665 domain-containing protein [Firmicutes bacterium]|nr:DUF5665 domain-containing protein [Bacillota bacterium]
MDRLHRVRGRRRNYPSKLDRFIFSLVKADLTARAELWFKPARLLWWNFLGGLARGFGIAVGLTIVAAAFLSFLGRLAAMNLPVIGRFVAEIVRLVELHLRGLPY